MSEVKGLLERLQALACSDDVRRTIAGQLIAENIPCYPKYLDDVFVAFLKHPDVLAVLSEVNPLVGAYHRKPTDCPTWHDSCHCTVENLSNQINYTLELLARAEAAEAKVKTVEAERDKQRAQHIATVGDLQAAERRAADLEAELKRRAEAIKSANADADMYAKAWQRELGQWMLSKRHHIDACVLATRRLVEGANKAASYTAAVDRWRKDTLTARTLGVAEPDLLEYLPAQKDAA